MCTRHESRCWAHSGKQVTRSFLSWIIDSGGLAGGDGLRKQPQAVRSAVQNIRESDVIENEWMPVWMGRSGRVALCRGNVKGKA